MVHLRQIYEWDVPGSKPLYGNQVLYQVVEHANEIVRALIQSPEISDNPDFMPAVTTPEAIS